MDWTTPQPPSEPPPTTNSTDGRWRRYGGKAALVGAGLVAGGVLATTLTANAATSSSSTPSASSESGSSADGGRGAHGGPGGGGNLSNTGTVTQVGASSVSIRDSAGKVTTYAVTSSSDIDKNGEAKLSDLKAGDAVTFSTSNGNTIGVLHSGNESLNRPQGGQHGDGDGPSGQPPSGYGYGG